MISDDQIKEVMRRADDYAFIASCETERNADSDPGCDEEREETCSSRAALEAYLRTIGEPESVNAGMLEALKSAKTGLEWYQDAHPESASECDNEAMQEIDSAIARTESAIETPAKVGQCAGHAVQQEADLCQIVGIKADGSETVLGSGVMPPTMKARKLLHNYGFDPSDDNGEGGYAMAAVEELIDWMKKVGWQAPALISVKQDANEAGGA